nr:sulfotransferase family 2 domain-containing protein [Roseovarius tolerans]
MPKCAGTTVRNLLGRLDDTGGKYESRVHDHPELGRLDYTHLPLEVLRRIAPEDFKKVIDYKAFTLIRDPQARFVSALSQRLKMYSTRELAQHDRADVNRLALQVVEALQEPDATHTPEFIHFARQSEFIFCDDEQLVETIYPVSKVSTMVQELSKLTREDLGQAGNDNPTMVFRFDAFRNLALAGKWVGERTLGPGRARYARNVVRQVLMKPLKNSSDIYMFSDEVIDFVRNYYAQDFDLYAKVMETFDTSPSRA